MSQPIPMQPGIGFPPDSSVNLERKIVWNTYLIATLLGGGGGGTVPVWVTVPASSGAAGSPGQMSYDNDYLYVHNLAGWRRIPLNDWA